ncbi:MAG: FAD-dependent oxidoreductase [Opitutales bacterium]
MFNKKKTDIAVVGAGPVGLIAAHALADRDMDFELFERTHHANVNSYALALLPETLILLEQLGVLEPVLEQSLQVKSIGIFDGEERRATMRYDDLATDYPFLAVIGQDELETILIKSLREKGCKPRWRHRMRYAEETEDGLNITVDRLSPGMTGYAMAHIDMEIDKVLDYHARYLIGADGHNSAARRNAGIDFPEMAPARHYAIFEFRPETTLPDEMRIIVKDGRSHIFWPMPDGYCRWSFETPEEDAINETNEKDRLFVHVGARGFPLLEEERLREQLKENAPWFDGTVKDFRWRMLVRFEQRLATSFGCGRTWLAGDAAHLAPPAGVLSMNVGMREAGDLVERLAYNASDADRTAALDSYNEERRKEWRALLDLDHHLHAKGAADPWLLKHKAALAGNIPATGDNLSALLDQVRMTEEA